VFYDAVSGLNRLRSLADNSFINIAVKVVDWATIATNERTSRNSRQIQNRKGGDMRAKRISCPRTIGPAKRELFQMGAVGPSSPKDHITQWLSAFASPAETGSIVSFRAEFSHEMLCIIVDVVMPFVQDMLVAIVRSHAPVHPPLACLAIGLPLYVAGERFPTLPVLDADSPGTVGNTVLNDSGHYMRNLILARLGVFPFLLLRCAVVFLWTRRVASPQSRAPRTRIARWHSNKRYLTHT
jgi:hypothetical protein